MSVVLWVLLGVGLAAAAGPLATAYGRARHDGEDRLWFALGLTGVLVALVAYWLLNVTALP